MCATTWLRLSFSVPLTGTFSFAIPRVAERIHWQMLSSDQSLCLSLDAYILAYQHFAGFSSPLPLSLALSPSSVETQAKQQPLQLPPSKPHLSLSIEDVSFHLLHWLTSASAVTIRCFHYLGAPNGRKVARVFDEPSALVYHAFM